MTIKDKIEQIKNDIDQVYVDSTVDKSTARMRMEDIIDYVEILIDSLTVDKDDEDEEDEDGGYKDGDDEDD